MWDAQRASLLTYVGHLGAHDGVAERRVRNLGRRRVAELRRRGQREQVGKGHAMSRQIHAAALNDRGTPVRFAPVGRHGVRASRAWSGVGEGWFHGGRLAKISPPTPTGLFGWLFFAGRWCPPRTERQNRAFAAFLRSWWASARRALWANEMQISRFPCFNWPVPAKPVFPRFTVGFFNWQTGIHETAISQVGKTASRNGRIRLRISRISNNLLREEIVRFCEMRENGGNKKWLWLPQRDASQ